VRGRAHGDLGWRRGEDQAAMNKAVLHPVDERVARRAGLLGARRSSVPVDGGRCRVDRARNPPSRYAVGRTYCEGTAWSGRCVGRMDGYPIESARWPSVPMSSADLGTADRSDGS
jgi:hypothetical protein